MNRNKKSWKTKRKRSLKETTILPSLTCMLEAYRSFKYPLIDLLFGTVTTLHLLDFASVGLSIKISKQSKMTENFLKLSKKHPRYVFLGCSLSNQWRRNSSLVAITPIQPVRVLEIIRNNSKSVCQILLRETQSQPLYNNHEFLFMC